jgi:putative ABC transport system permease protein
VPVSADLVIDVRYAIRALGRAKASAAVLMASLAAGLGANAVLYSAIDGLLFRAPAGVVRPSRLVTISTSQFSGAGSGLSSWPDVRAIVAEAPALAQVAAFDDARVEPVRLKETTERVRIVEATAALFEVLGGAPEVGRRLGSSVRDDERPPAVISDALWSTFGRPADIAGQSLQIGDRDYVVTGVAPAGFRGQHLSRTSDVWIPLDLSLRQGRGDRRLSVIARLAEGAGLDGVQRQVNGVAARLADRFPETNRGGRGDTQAPRRMSVLPYTRVDASSGGPVLLLGAAAMGATLMLLVSACVNAASVLVSRSAARRRELAVKVALGASRQRLVQQALVEGWLLAACGAALGLLLAYYTARVLPSLLTPDEAEMLTLTVDARAVAALLVFALAAGALFAAGPARHVMTTLDVDALRAGAGEVSTSRGPTSLRTVIVTGQVALSTVILIGTGVLVQAMSTALEGEAGAAGRGIAIAMVEIPGDGIGPDPAEIDYPSRARDAVRKLPGVADAGWVLTLPLRQPGSGRFQIDAPQGLLETVDVDINIASAGYFATMGMALIEGRTFDGGDRPRSERVVVVNDVLATRYFGAPGLGSAAVGQHLRDAEGRRLKIVGVVQSARYRTLEPSPGPALYFAPRQQDLGVMHLMVKATGDAGPMLERLRATLLAASPRARVLWTKTFDDHVAQALTLDRVMTTVVAASGLLALALSTIGVYGVSADAVRRRTAEIGLRLALGARPRSVVALIGREALTLTVAGVALGTCAALALAALARSFVHGLPWPDLPTVVVVSAALVFVALAAAAPPSWRALRISPTVALRAE